MHRVAPQRVPLPDHTRRVVLEWCHEFCNATRRHSIAKVMSPINYEKRAVLEPEAVFGRPHDSGGVSGLCLLHMQPKLAR